jgi:hypothetical protein
MSWLKKLFSKQSHNPASSNDSAKEIVDTSIFRDS